MSGPNPEAFLLEKSTNFHTLSASGPDPEPFLIGNHRIFVLGACERGLSDVTYVRSYVGGTEMTGCNPPPAYIYIKILYIICYISP